MKKLSAEQIQNIVFTALIVLVAGVIYILAGRNAERAREQSAAEKTPAPTAEISAEPRFSLVPESVFTDAITNDGSFSARKRGERAYELVCGMRRAGGAELSYSVDDDGFVNSVTFSFVVLAKPWAKPRTPIEETYVFEYDEFIAAQNDALMVLLPACFSACDLDNALIEPILLRWYSAALASRDDGKTFEDVYAGARFATYPSQKGDHDVVICTLMPS